MAKTATIAPVTVQCPLCKEDVKVEDYDSITRTDALMGHIVTRHTSKVLPMPPQEGPPLPKGANVRWPWREGG